MAAEELLIRINGNAKSFTDELDRVKKKTADLEKSLGTVAKVSAAAFVALAGAVAVSIQRFTAFEKTFSNVLTLLDKGSFGAKDFKTEVNKLKNDIIKLGADTGESFDSLNKGLFDLISSGVKASDATATLRVAAELAAAGATTTDVAVKALAATLTSFGDSAGSASDIAEKFFTAQKFGVTTVGELATEFNKVAGIAKNLGISFDETLASLSSLTANGAKPTAEASTALKRTLSSLILVQKDLKKESAEVQDALSLENIKSRGLVASLDLLKIATGGNVVDMQRLLGSAEALGTVLSLTGEQSELVKLQMKELGDETKRNETFQAALAEKNATTEKALDRLYRSVEAIAIVFGEAFAPAINSAADAISKIARSFSELDKDTVKTIATVTKWLLLITGLTAALATLGIAYLKIRGTLLALNTAFGISSGIVKLYNFTLTAGKKAAELFSIGMRLATTTVRGFAAATGIGLVLVALSLMISNLKETKAIALGTFAAIKTVISNFASGVFNQLKGIGGILVGIFTLDKDKILQGLNDLKDGVITNSIGLGKGAGEAFYDAYSKSIEESNAVEIPAPIVDEPPAEKKKEADKKADIDTSNLDRLLAKEREAAAKIAAIRDQQNDLLEDKARLAALKRVEIKDEELKKLQDKEIKAQEELIALKEQQVGLLTSIDQLEVANAELAAKDKLTAKERVQLEANQRELEILQGQLETIKGVLAAEQAEEVANAEARNIAKLERIQQQFEEEQALEAELQELKTEQRDLLDEEDLEKFQNQIMTKRDIEKQIAEEQLQDNIKRRNQFLKDEEKHGKLVAELNKFKSSQELALADQTSSQLVALTNSKNAQLKSIGKAASLVQVGIKTAEGAISAYSSLAGIPIIGPALGAAAAGALIAYGAEQAAAITSAQRGGIVPNAQGGARDRVPTLLEPGELVVPKAIAPDFIQSVGRPDAEGGGGGGVTEVIIGFTEDAFQIIEQKLNERGAIGVGGV